jgi:hypothetical protein
MDEFILPEDTHKSTERSTVILDNMRRRRLEELFDMMDGDGDGFISADNIDLESLPTNVIEILGSVIQDLEMYGICMNKESWVENSLKKVAMLNTNDRSLLFKREKP